MKTSGKIKLLSILLMAVNLSACLRGESKTVGELITKARTDFAQTSRDLSAVPEALRTKVSATSAALDAIADYAPLNSLDEKLGEIESNLGQLVEHAGFTVRPGMNELLNQYRTLRAKSASIAKGAPELKVIAARTYSTLSNELNTTKFRL